MMRAVALAVLVALAPALARADDAPAVSDKTAFPVAEGAFKDESGGLHEVRAGVYLSPKGVAEIAFNLNRCKAENKALREAARPDGSPAAVILIAAAVALGLGFAGGFAVAKAAR
jgi:hypothetical protein